MNRSSIERKAMEFDPTRALARVVLANSYDPTNSLPALLNPEGLNVHIGINVGTMNPIGSSHGVEQYASTNSPEFPLEFYFSQEVAYRRDYEMTDINRAVNWLAANGYGRERGTAPDPLLVLWPNVLSLLYIVKDINIEYNRFSRKLQLQAAKVSLNGCELRTDFHTYDRHIQDGFQRPGFADAVNDAQGPPQAAPRGRGRKG